MPRQQKRKAEEIDYDDPLAYVAEYCRRRAISYQIGQSEAEKECLQLANEAREDFKSRRDSAVANSGEGSSPQNDSTARDLDVDRKGLSPAQKYIIRLQNNRKSANASKVYNEVLKREQAACLQKFSALRAENQRPRSRVSDRESLLTEKERTLQAEVERLKALLEEKTRASVKTSPRRLDADDCDDQIGEEHSPIAHGSPKPRRTNVDLSRRNTSPSFTPPKQRSQERKGDKSAETYRHDQTNHIATGTIDGSQQDCVHPRSSQENMGRNHNPRGPSHPFSMSLSQSEMKDMHVGVNLTQSQTEHQEEMEEKGKLIRNLPRSGGIPVAVVDSQPSQSEDPVFQKFSGSEDLISSQGTVEGGTPKRVRLL